MAGARPEDILHSTEQYSLEIRRLTESSKGSDKEGCGDANPGGGTGFRPPGALVFSAFLLRRCYFTWIENGYPPVPSV